MPDMIPVGNTIVPPNPMQGINTLSGVLGLQQQQQQLRSETAAATIAAQNAKENQGLARLLQDPVGNGLTDADGTPLPGAFAKFQSVAPTGGAAKYQQWIDAARAKVGLRSDVTSLSNALRGQVGSIMSGDTAANSSRETTVQNLIQLAQDNPEAAGVAIRAASHLPDEPHLTGDPLQDGPLKAQHLQQLNAYRSGFGRSVLAPSEAAGLALPITGAQFDKQGNLIGTAQSKVTGAISSPQQGGVQVGLGPTQTPGYLGAVAGAGAAATGGVGRDVDRANLVSTSQRDASALLPLTNEVDRLSHEISASAIAGRVTEGLKNLGFTDVANARTQLTKDLGLLKGPLAARAGSDSRAASLLEGYPTDQTPENTTHAAMDYIRGTFRQTMARGRLLRSHGQDGFAAADDELTRSTDPLVYEAASLKPGQSNGFYRRNFGSPQEAQSFKNRVDAIRKHTEYLGGSE